MAKNNKPETTPIIPPETTETKTRTYKTVQERVDELDKKIAYHQEAIDKFNLKKKTLLESKNTDKTQIKTLMEILKTKGKSVEDIMKLLETDSLETPAE